MSQDNTTVTLTVTVKQLENLFDSVAISLTDINEELESVLYESEKEWLQENKELFEDLYSRIQTALSTLKTKENNHE